MSDSYLSFAYRLSSSVQRWRLTVQCSIYLKRFVCRVVFPSVCSASFALCFHSPHFLRSIFCASKRSLEFCVFLIVPLLSSGIVCAMLEISLPKSSSCVSPAASICISIFATIAVSQASSSSSVPRPQQFNCAVQAASGWLPFFNRSMGQNRSMISLFLGWEVPRNHISSRPPLRDRHMVKHHPTLQLFLVFDNLPVFCSSQSM